ncbi:MAG: mannose-6-phosphate isomerase, class I [Acidimicrobiaceae bacterium]|nr:mannose-6-phosphate isomerase, class I [Acidimicrobiaceae bacterium]MDE0607909.1 mannose-6-phosphate isomerase, class I [Acidimicrobiaceae bacterium]
MVLIDGALKNYDWGSVTAIPELLGRGATGEPVAELWFGAHPSGPAVVRASDIPLDEHIEADPVAALGAAVADEFGSLPFLLKVLAAGSPLSLQAHPSTAQACAGFEREESLGIDRNGENRCFRDRRHKPELICALSEFSALCGFREPAESLGLLATIPTEALDPVRARLTAEPSSEGVRGLLQWLLSHSRESAADLVESVVSACLGESSLPFAAEREMVVELGRRYRGDPAVVVALLLNLVTLQPGETIFFGPGNLHAYLRGTGVELMANSDNVVRAGLTTKHVDVATLLDIVDTTPMAVDVQRPSAVDGVVSYRSPVPEFSLQRIDLNGVIQIEPGPAILLCASGRAHIEGEAARQPLPRGSAAWMPASDGPAHLNGTATLFRAGLGPA